MDVSRGEAVEHELNRLIEKRHDQRATEDGHRASEELWQESIERYNSEREREVRVAWCNYHQDQAARHRRTLKALITRHEKAAARLLERHKKRRRHDQDL